MSQLAAALWPDPQIRRAPIRKVILLSEGLTFQKSAAVHLLPLVAMVM